jgi:holdfast attachment protein HfaA
MSRALRDMGRFVSPANARLAKSAGTTIAFSLRTRIPTEPTRVRTFTLIAAALLATPASADPIPNGTGDVERPFAMNWESFDTPINPATRDESGNRTIVSGRIEIEGSLTGGIMDGFGSGLGGNTAQAIGNQLNVVTQGNYNTVIIDSTQINNGDISADSDGGN